MQNSTHSLPRIFAALFGAAAIAAPAAATAGNLPTSCNDKAETEANEGLNLLHNMMYIQAEAAFGRAHNADPSCAMAMWGVAMANFHPLWPGGPTPAETERGTAAAQSLAKMAASTPLEMSFIDAAMAFYAPDLDGYRNRLAAWAEKQVVAGTVHADNIDAAALGALARLTVAPRGPERIEVLAEVGDDLDLLHKANPDHAGVIHYAIHAYDNPPLKSRGLPYAEIYDKTAPTAPHALHMPAHIFTRTGNWEKSIDLNRRSAEVALAQSGDIIQNHYAHAIDYMVYGHLQRGEHEQAAQLVAEMIAIENHQVGFGGAYALAASPVRILLEAEDWAGAATLSPKMHSAIPWENFPQTVAMRWFAKGLGAARSGDIANAREAAAELVRLRETMLERNQGYWAQLTEAQILSVEGWIELAEGNTDLALIHQSAAADLEDKIGKSPVTPGHVLPARELLGDMLVKLGKIDAAMDAYRTTLMFSPNRSRSLSALK